MRTTIGTIIYNRMLMLEVCARYGFTHGKKYIVRFYLRDSNPAIEDTLMYKKLANTLSEIADDIQEKSKGESRFLRSLNPEIIDCITESFATLQDRPESFLKKPCIDRLAVTLNEIDGEHIGHRQLSPEGFEDGIFFKRTYYQMSLSYLLEDMLFCPALKGRVETITHGVYR